MELGRLTWNRNVIDVETEWNEKEEYKNDEIGKFEYWL